MNTHLLIISCSHRTRPDRTLVPAIRRYDSRLYRILRDVRFNLHWPAGLRILILTARYGLIDELYPTSACAHADRMTAERRFDLLPVLHAQLTLALAARPAGIFINLSVNYRQAIPITFDYEAFAAGVDLRWATGDVDARLAQTRAWLCSIIHERRLSLYHPTLSRFSRRFVPFAVQTVTPVQSAVSASIR